ncbi:MAG: SulP family inorganic anion transporter [Bacteroidota bacterium]|nr:SulP family inorganic anion transporter [Bacteroidota bacterium]
MIASPITKRKLNYYRLIWLKHDLPAGLTVFLVALPLCLGIALASNAPLYAGILSGVIGGIVVTGISGSNLAVSGPAAGFVACCCSSYYFIGRLPHIFSSRSFSRIDTNYFRTF